MYRFINQISGASVTCRNQEREKILLVMPERLAKETLELSLNVEQSSVMYGE